MESHKGFFEERTGDDLIVDGLRGPRGQVSHADPYGPPSVSSSSSASHIFADPSIINVDHSGARLDPVIKSVLEDSEDLYERWMHLPQAINQLPLYPLEFFLGGEREEMRHAPSAQLRLVWDSSRACQWASFPLDTVPRVPPTKTPFPPGFLTRAKDDCPKLGDCEIGWVNIRSYKRQRGLKTTKTSQFGLIDPSWIAAGEEIRWLEVLLDKQNRIRMVNTWLSSGSIGKKNGTHPCPFETHTPRNRKPPSESNDLSRAGHESGSRRTPIRRSKAIKPSLTC